MTLFKAAGPTNDIHQYMEVWENISRDLDDIVKNPNKRSKNHFKKYQDPTSFDSDPVQLLPRVREIFHQNSKMENF